MPLSLPTSRFCNTFDPWVSSSTGHQRAEVRPPTGTGWRNLRNAKLRLQFGGELAPPFAAVVVYVNGSTYPLVSDHYLRRLLSRHGARLSLHMARRSVTHVILGQPASGGAGGGLAAGKLEREIRLQTGCSVKYVGVEWVLQSIEAGRRLPEEHFTPLKIAQSRQPRTFQERAQLSTDSADSDE